MPQERSGVFFTPGRDPPHAQQPATGASEAVCTKHQRPYERTGSRGADHLLSTDVCRSVSRRPDRLTI
ncbi:hypothetical protein NHX12_005253 [Muraenolepis orangiensis]|uniref:Uncharacterized protein n=1 Tax=Muraenolepis orangiensis TaxID=630683 RepID=A0A9Q0IC47_9TELE|nr:hypothetical protein NHX12_005253 [Muraenolepis orangiensis]